jgi:hypothetical protein
MTKHKTKLLIIVTVILGTVAAFVPFVIWTAHAAAPEYAGGNNHHEAPAMGGAAPVLSAMPMTAATPVAARVSTPTSASSALLNARHRFALGMIETANNDWEIGGAGEVSRYQIMPSVWKHYSASRSYQDPDVSLEVAQQHWTALHTFFKQQAHREPTDFDMYVLWNTRYGYYASRGFNPAHLNLTVRDRAQRFANLVERGES